jgi:hypothetical protein
LHYRAVEHRSVRTMKMKTSVNHFERKKVNGVETWTWEDEPGSMCGRSRRWTYKVQIGDTHREAGTCPQGYKYFELEIGGTPERLP